jgi:chromate reductase
VFIGSLSKDSVNRQLAHAAERLAPDTLELREIGIGDLPLYDRDFDAAFPEAGRTFKKAVEEVDALMFVTPEYNRSIPGALKNAIDRGSRPWGSNSSAHMPSAVIGTSPGKIGTAVGQQHLGSILSFVNSPEPAQPEACMQFTGGRLRPLSPARCSAAGGERS